MSDTHDKIPPLVTLGDPRLARPSLPVKLKIMGKPTFQRRIEILLQAMNLYGGIGIAAPQIGWFERFFLLMRQAGDGEEGGKTRIEAWVNPEIVESSTALCWAWEGCLSVQGLRGWICRPQSVSIRGFKANGERVSTDLNGWDARVFQHEFDHLDGWLFPYRVQDVRHLVSETAFDQREHWPADWPAPHARDLPYGELVEA